MNRVRDSVREARAREIRLTYETYARSPVKRRAWDAGNAGNAQILAELWRRLDRLAAPELRSGEVLDAGCGTGRWLTQLVAHGVRPASLHGLDLLEPRVEAARAAVPGAAIVTGDLTAMPYHAGRFHLVLLFTALSSLPGAAAVEEALAEVRRVLHPSGVAIVYEPRVPTPRNGATRWIRPCRVAAALNEPEALESLTVAPPLARRLGPLAASTYPLLAALPPLRTHWIGAFRPR